MSEIDKFLFGEGGNAFKFDEIGDTVEGTVIDAVMADQRSLDTGAPLTWEDGRPKRQLVVTLQTELHDNDDDEGVRRIYAKGGNYEVASGTGTAMKNAIADAVKKSGASTIEPGGHLKVGYSGEGKRTNRGY